MLGKIKFGEVFLAKDRIVIDAEPHIMGKIRSLFKTSYGWESKGKYTHKPICVPNTLTVCRDITWIIERYPMTVSDADLIILKRKSDEYEDLISDVAGSDKNVVLDVAIKLMQMSVTPRPDQIGFYNMAKKMKKMLLADPMGLGKTISSLLLLCDPECRPALIIVPPSICTQWLKVIEAVVPDASVHYIPGMKPYDLPNVDFIITSYNRVSKWEDTLITENFRFKTVIMDEVHELRHVDTEKRKTCQILSERAEYSVGLSGTPIWNQGSEIWSVIDCISKNSLGEERDFRAEWCDGDKVSDPIALNRFLKNMGVMLRRTPEEVGLKYGNHSKDIITIDTDLKKLKEVEDIAKTLALTVLSGKAGLDSSAAKEFDYKLRQATGIAKAKSVAEFVKMLVESGEKVLLAGWHREFWDIVCKELAQYKIVIMTGSESPSQKDASKDAFINGDSKVIGISLRSGAGVDGLQYAASVIVIGELDPSPHAMDQLIMRLDRPGQNQHVKAFYLTVADGSDPTMMEKLNIKRGQHEGLVEGKDGDAKLFEVEGPSSMERIRLSAERFLKSIGEEIPVRVEETGLLGDIAKGLRNIRFNYNSEDEMQRALEKVLPSIIPEAKIEREYKISARSRLDFLITRGDEKIAFECKITSKSRPEVYKQVRRYASEVGITSVVLMAPWHGIDSFSVDGTPVIVIDSTKNSI